MTIIKIESVNGYHTIESQSHREENWMGEEWIEVPSELEDNLNGGYCNLTIEDGVLTNVTPTSIPVNMDKCRNERITYLSSTCNNAITNGFDIELSNTSGHVSLTPEDQINLTTAYASVQNGIEQYPYHLDGQLCQMFSAEDITKIAQTATAHKLYHTTYFNHLKAWAERCETKDELDAIFYGSELPEDLASSMNSIISAASSL